MPPTMFAKTLKALHTARGLTQVQLAKKLKVTQPYVAQLESGGEPNPSLASVRRLAKAWRAPVWDLVK